MNPALDESSRAAVSAKFDLLRVKLETTVVRPAVITVVASTSADGGSAVARGLASSLASTGYSTLFVDASLNSHSSWKSSPGFSLDQIGLLHSTPEPRSGIAAVLTLGDLALQKTTSQRDVQSALSVFRRKFDYVVICVEYVPSKSFATSFFIAADAVVVSVRKGRREEAHDVQLADDLEGIGSRFLGLVALDPAVIEKNSLVNNAAATFDGRRGQGAPAENERIRRENAESATS